MNPRENSIQFVFSSGFRRSFALALFLLSFSALRAAPDLRAVLSPEDFQKAGLEKLSPAELAFLSERLLGGVKNEATRQAPAPADASASFGLRPAPAAAPAQPAVSEETLLAARELDRLPKGEAAFGHEEKLQVKVVQIQKVPDKIHSRIKGSFEGWTGKTIFRLENGQVWRQAEKSNFSVSLESPGVTITKGLFGSFLLKVDGYGSTVKVLRVE